MRSIKTYEGFFDFFKKKISEEDKVCQEYISRLEKVKGISPYKITSVFRDDEQIEKHEYKVEFDDSRTFFY
jgi:hypothetical protein